MNKLLVGNKSDLTTKKVVEYNVAKVRKASAVTVMQTIVDQPAPTPTSAPARNSPTS